MTVQATPMPSDTCSVTRSCVWRAASRLTAAGRSTLPSDLCIAITASGEPCARQAEQMLGVNTYAEDHALEDDPVVGQPFCQWHAALITRDVLKSAISNNHQAVIDEAIGQRRMEHREIEETRGVVYFARRGSDVKIGFTVNPKSRIRALELGGGVLFDEVVVMRGTRSTEAKFHRMFADFRGVGEWFTMGDPIRLVMDEMDPFPALTS